MSLRTLTLISVMALGLTGCVSLSTPDLEQSWQGRFSISAESATNRENHSGRFTLTHTSDVLTILDLKSPLGNTLARITQTPKKISLETLGNPTLLMQSHFCWKPWDSVFPSKDYSIGLTAFLFPEAMQKLCPINLLTDKLNKTVG